MKPNFLKDIEENDLEMIRNWRNQERVRKVMYNKAIILEEEHYQWFEALKKDNTKISKIFYYKNKPAGIININEINYEHKRCKWGFYLGENFGVKGIGLFLGYMGLKYIFEELHINRVCGEVLKSNEISGNFHTKLGFSLEGKLREYILEGEVKEDIFIYSLLSKEWAQQKKIIEQELEGLI